MQVSLETHRLLPGGLPSGTSDLMLGAALNRSPPQEPSGTTAVATAWPDDRPSWVCVPHTELTAGDRTGWRQPPPARDFSEQVP